MIILITGKTEEPQFEQVGIKMTQVLGSLGYICEFCCNYCKHSLLYMSDIENVILLLQQYTWDTIRVSLK